VQKQRMLLVPRSVERLERIFVEDVVIISTIKRIN